MAESRNAPVAFLQLNYVNAKLLNENNHECSVVTREGPADARAIVYLNQPVSADKFIRLDVDYRQTHGPGHVFALGVTNCDIETISNNFYHIQDECNERFVCGSSSKSVRIGSSAKPSVDSVEFTKDDSKLIKIIINGKATIYLKDESGRMDNKPLMPYIILSGSARRIRVSEKVIAPPVRLDQDMARSAFRSLWRLASGIDWLGEQMHRKANSPNLYAYFSLSLREIGKLSFTIKNVDPKWQSGSLSLGVTSWSLSQVSPNSLPINPSQLNTSEPYKQYWQSFLNPVPIVAPGTQVTLRLTPAGLLLEVESSKMMISSASRLAKLPQLYVFLHFGGKVSHIEFDIPPEALKDRSLSKEPVAPAPFMSDLCLICHANNPTHAVNPCGHVILCSHCCSYDHFACSYCLYCNKSTTGVFPAFQ